MIPKTVDEQLLYSTLRIELLSSNNELLGIGTGFIFIKKVNQNQKKIFLISNKHVLKGGKNVRITFIKRKPDNSGPELGSVHQFIIRDYMDVYSEHPNDEIDIACLNITEVIIRLQNQIFYRYLDESLLATFDEEELDVAQRVTFIGYPNNRYDQAHNLPIIRTGLIASHPKIDFNGIKQFIIDAQVFPGSSGSPVMINLTYENYKNGKIVIGKPKIRLLGIIAATMVRNNQIKSIPTSKNLISQEVIGLGIVYKSTALKELINLV
jgi:hypothetical protein